MNDYFPSTNIPSDLYDAFTANRSIAFINNYRADSQLREHPHSFTAEQIALCFQLAKQRKCLNNSATDRYFYQALDHYFAELSNKDGIVIHSREPWYESILSMYNVRPFTLGARPITCTDPKIKTVTLNSLISHPKLFDTAVAIDLIQHQGLGCYGEPLNPRGDLDMMASIKPLLKKDGLLFLSVPVGKDCLVWNQHRIYGASRLKTLCKGWRILGYFGFSYEDLTMEGVSRLHQPIFVLKPLHSHD